LLLIPYVQNHSPIDQGLNLSSSPLPFKGGGFMQSLKVGGGTNRHQNGSLDINELPQISPQNLVTIFRHRSAVKKALDMIQERIHDPPTLAELAKSSGLSRTYLSCVFKEVTGTRLKDYVGQIRLKKAKDLLGDINLKIKQIAYEVGFSDPNYFCRIFKKKTGLTPTNYRARQILNLKNHNLRGATPFEKL